MAQGSEMKKEILFINPFNGKQIDPPANFRKRPGFNMVKSGDYTAPPETEEAKTPPETA